MAEPPTQTVDVFFYGLFMDENLLREKGAHPAHRRIASVENFALVIGERATLVATPNQTVHGLIFSLTPDEVEALYSDPSVSAYRPETVSARTADGSIATALCFVLPSPPTIEERNPEYAAKLRRLADRIGLPSSYVSSIQ